MGQPVEEWCTPALQGMQKDRVRVARSMLPAAQEQTNPGERQCPHRGLRGRPLVPLLLVVGAGPAGMPRGVRRPCDARWAQELGALETPVTPGLVAAACRPRRNASILLPLISRGVAGAWCATGDEETWGKDGASAWEGVTEGAVGMALGAVGNGLVAIRARVEGHAALGHKGLDQEGLGGDEAFLGGQRRSALDGVAALGADLSVAHVRGAEAACQGGASRQLYGLEGRPLGEDVAEDGGICGAEPWPHMRTVVCQGTGQAMRDAHVVSEQAAAMFHALFEGAPGRTLGLKGLELIAMCEQEFKEAFGVRGSSWTWLGVKASRYRARMRGVRGKSPRKASWRSAETRGP
jgi:hypothetical protein